MTQVRRAVPSLASPGGNNVEASRTITEHCEALANGADIHIDKTLAATGECDDALA